MDLGSIRRFFEHDLWRGDLRRVGWGRRLGLGTLRVAAHLAVAFGRNLSKLQAAGLTLVTLLSLVPLLALVFAIAKAFGYGERLQKMLLEQAEGLPPALEDAMRHLHALVDRTSFGALGLLGTAVLVWSAFTLFTRVEQAFNHVWRAVRRRSWYRRLADFLALVIIVPALVLGALLFQSLLTSAEVMESVRTDWPWLAWLYHAGLGFLPWLMLCIACTALYKAMPSTRVHWRGAVVAGVVAGTGLLLLHAVYIRFQVGAARANAIYGTLAALPLLLVYLQLTWTVVLVGAEVSYAVQNLHQLRGAEHLPAPTQAIRKRLAWHVVRAAAEGFRGRRGGCALDVLAMELDVPREWIDEVVEALQEQGLVLPLQGEDDRVAPGRPPDDITFAEVCRAAEGADRGEFLDRVRLPEEQEGRLREADAALGRALGGHPF